MDLQKRTARSASTSSASSSSGGKSPTRTKSKLISQRSVSANGKLNSPTRLSSSTPNTPRQRRRNRSRSPQHPEIELNNMTISRINSGPKAGVLGSQNSLNGSRSGLTASPASNHGSRRKRLGSNISIRSHSASPRNNSPARRQLPATPALQR